MNKKVAGFVFLLFISMLNPGCKHEKMDSKQIYLKYLKSRIKTS
ncbi:hypothetical protein [Pedobacter sp. HMWF019]|nr:hypothetical protein [Pedobacter sp. HMWF019]